jgi:hypothetical protein
MKSSKGKSYWDYYKPHAKGHINVIHQKSESLDDIVGSQLILLNKDFYDFELRLTANIFDEDGTLGILFRHQNAFNFYVFEVSRKDKGFKRVRKFINGKPEVLAFKSDGAYLPEKWLTFRIIATSTEFKIFFTNNELQGKDFNLIDRNLEHIFTINDSTFSHRTVAFSSLSIESLYLDDISIKQLSCTDFLSSSIKINALSESCNKYVELFMHINANWEIIDPKNFEGGPSEWRTVSNFQNRENVLAQLSEIYSLDDNEEGTIFLLKEKNCEKGIIKVKGIVPNFNGEIEITKSPKRATGIVFKYKDENNFYLLEIFNNSLIRIRKKTLGKYILLSQNPLIGFEYNLWFKIMLFIKNSKFSVKFFKDSNKPEFTEVFQEDLIDDEFKFGRIGLYSFKSKVYFSDFETFSFNLNNIGNNKNIEINPLYIDESEDLKIKRFLNSKILQKNKSNVGTLKLDSLKKLNQNIYKYNFIISQMNSNVENFSWRKCLINQSPEKKYTGCKILFNSERDIKNCEDNFCKACCSKFVGMLKINKSHKYLCIKQCNILSFPSSKIKIWNKCLILDQYSLSFYKYCDNAFSDINKLKENKRCKVDMCRLYCINVDLVNPIGRQIPLMSLGLLKRCDEECGKSKFFLNF